MSYQKTCSYEECTKHFATEFRHQRYCSKSCGAKAQAVRSPESIRQYLLARIIETESGSEHGPCWIWQGFTNDRGRAIACIRSKREFASRVAYEVFVGPIPQGLYLLHSCDNPRCIAPKHLTPGTKRQNAKERNERHRQVRGSQHYNTHLTEKDIRDILHAFHEKGETQQEISVSYDVSYVTIHDIIYRVTWTHVLEGQYPPPTQDGRARVTKEEVKLMRQLYEGGYTLGDLQRRFGITASHIWRICMRQVWKHID